MNESSLSNYFKQKEKYDVNCFSLDFRYRDSLAISILKSLQGSRLEDEIDSLEYFLNDKIKSPIERIFVAALMEIAPSLYEIITYEHQDIDGKPKCADELIIEPQFKIDNMVIDFRITSKSYDKHTYPKACIKQILVECDGHDFHEKTKSQAKKDRSRDRSLQKLGYKILRFTGSEIYANPFLCAEEMLNFL